MKNHQFFNFGDIPTCVFGDIPALNFGDSNVNRWAGWAGLVKKLNITPKEKKKKRKKTTYVQLDQPCW